MKIFNFISIQENKQYFTIIQKPKDLRIKRKSYLLLLFVLLNLEQVHLLVLALNSFVLEFRMQLRAAMLQITRVVMYGQSIMIWVLAALKL